LTVLCSRDTPFPAFAGAAEQVRRGAAPSVEASVGRWFTEAEAEAAGPAVVQARHDLEAASLPDWAAALDAIAQYDREAATATLTLPVVAIAAGQDAVSTPEVMRAMAERIAGARYHVVPPWCHMSPFVDPLGLARLLTEHRDAALSAR
jgi:pimeloyl-ACP methyl ester carboxylesterase